MTARRLYNFWIDPDLAEGLKRLKERDGVPESEQVRRALREWLQKKGIPKAARRGPESRDEGSGPLGSP